MVSATATTSKIVLNSCSSQREAQKLAHLPVCGLHFDQDVCCWAGEGHNFSHLPTPNPRLSLTQSHGGISPPASPWSTRGQCDKTSELCLWTHHQSSLSPGSWRSETLQWKSSSGWLWTEEFELPCLPTLLKGNLILIYNQEEMKTTKWDDDSIIKDLF